MPRIGAEYFHPNDQSSPVIVGAQGVFLGRVEDVATEVLVDLLEGVLPTYKATWIAAEDSTLLRRTWWERSAASWFIVASMDRQSPPASGYQALFPLWDTLYAWCGRWHLTDEWLLAVALRTLYGWVQEDPAGIPPGELRFQRPTEGELMLRPPQPSLEVRPCEPLAETWTAYKKDAKKTFDEWLQRYAAEMKEWAEVTQIHRSPEKRARRGTKDTDLHFEWLVRFQVQDWTYDRIALHYGGLDVSTARDAVVSTSEMIQLTRRTME